MIYYHYTKSTIDQGHKNCFYSSSYSSINFLYLSLNGTLYEWSNNEKHFIYSSMISESVLLLKYNGTKLSSNSLWHLNKCLMNLTYKTI